MTNRTAWTEEFNAKITAKITPRLDDELIERLFWEYDAEAAKSGQQRWTFKCYLLMFANYLATEINNGNLTITPIEPEQ